MATRTVVSVSCDVCGKPMDIEKNVEVDGLVLSTKWVTGKQRKVQLDMHAQCVPEYLKELVDPGLKVRIKRHRDAKSKQKQRTAEVKAADNDIAGA